MSTGLHLVGWLTAHPILTASQRDRGQQHHVPTRREGSTSGQVEPGGSSWQNYFDGTLDEVRISNIARSDCWVQTGYNNQSAPATYVAVSATEQAPAPTAVTLSAFTATGYEDGVLVEWRTGYEVNNLGFHIYREQDGQLYRLTPEPVAGSALLAGQGTALGAGHKYFWWDVLPSPQSSLSPHHSSLSPVRYWLKDIDLSGKDTMHGPVTPVFSREPLPEKFRPELLSERGMKLQERYQDYLEGSGAKGKNKIAWLKDRYAYVSLLQRTGRLRALRALGAFH